MVEADPVAQPVPVQAVDPAKLDARAIAERRSLGDAAKEVSFGHDARFAMIPAARAEDVAVARAKESIREHEIVLVQADLGLVLRDLALRLPQELEERPSMLGLSPRCVELRPELGGG